MESFNFIGIWFSEVEKPNPWIDIVVLGCNLYDLYTIVIVVIILEILKILAVSFSCQILKQSLSRWPRQESRRTIYTPLDTAR